MRIPHHLFGIRFKTTLALVLFGVGISLATIFIVRGGVLAQFIALEKQLADEDLERAKNFIKFRTMMLRGLARDYGFWNDTYRYLGGENPDYVQENLKLDQFDSLKVDLMALTDPGGRLVLLRYRPPAGQADEATRESSAAVAEVLADILGSGTPGGEEEGRSGIISLPEGEMMVASAQVLRNDRSGPSRGYFVFGRWLDKEFRLSLHQVTQTEVRLTRVPAEAVVRHRIDLQANTLTSTAVVEDWRGHPVAQLELTREMRNYALGQRLIKGLSVATVVVTLGGVAFLSILLDALVLSRLSRLRHDLERVSQGKQELPGEAVGGRDEIGSLAEITRRAFSRLAAEESKVKASEVKYRAVVEQSPEGIFLANEEDWLIGEANDSFARMLGHEGKDLTGAALEQLPGEPSPPLAQVREAFGRSGRVVFQLRQQLPLNTLKFELVRLQVAGKRVICGMVEDLGERERLHDHMRRAEVAETVGQLAGGVAHDFNNLLTVIMSATELLSRDVSLSRDSEESVKAIKQAARSASDLTRKLLLYGRRGPLQRKSCDLAGLLRELQPMLVRVIPENIHLQVRTQEGLPLALVDARALEQVVINLVLNARDAMPRGGRLELAVERDPEVDTARITVMDSGEGIAVEVQAKIFEPFFTTKPMGKGSGLGLSTVMGIIQQHEGSIQVVSAPGSGTQFIIRLPWARPGERLTTTAEPVNTPSAGRGLVLLVEDEAAIRDMLRLILLRAGYEVVEAATGAEALAVARKMDRRPQALVSDVIMPGHLSGFDVASDLTALFPGLKVILMSGYNPEMLDAGSEWQRNSHPDRFRFINKPFDSSVLLEELAALLSAAP
jgi:PAS domain S-box-containing protein